MDERGWNRLEEEDEAALNDVGLRVVVVHDFVLETTECPAALECEHL